MYKYLIVLIFCSTWVSAQTDSLVIPGDSLDLLPDSVAIIQEPIDSPIVETYYSDYVVYNGDTIPLSYLDEVVLVERPKFSSNEDRRAYFRLRRKVFKVYKYALVASQKLTEMEEQTEGLKRRRQKRKYTREVERYMREEFEAELRKLTRSEGKILIKLIYRQTGYTTHELIKEYRGGINAFIYQTTAGFYDADLKATYDPFTQQEDATIEMILQRAFAAGDLEKQKTPVNFSSDRTNNNVLGQ